MGYMRDRTAAIVQVSRKALIKSFLHRYVGGWS